MALTDNDRVIIKSAEEDFLNGNYQQTIRKMDNLRPIVGDNYELLILQARAYSKLGNQEMAINIINELDDSETKSGDITFIINMYLSDTQFISARKVSLQLSGPHSEKLFDSIVLAENNYRKNHRHELVKLQRKLFYIGNHSADVQAKIVRDATHLPLTEYLEGVAAVLVDKAGWQVIKTQFLFELINLQIDDEVNFLWLDDQIHKLIPSQINLNKTMRPLVESEKIITTEYGNDDPITAQLLSAQVFQFGNYLFPYTDEVIADATAWVKIISRYVLEQQLVPSSDVDDKIISWLKVILKQEQRIKYM
ncbi:hypothetical protein [Lentilactobacillus sp. SPB1-3]|uniref:Uncharacterized protein n=1 Tax=Lentilactobacillus terminaliae TaxID=3003483 RepID=A0ACD5DD52_9LACO|nr:hypothetical protein [Lentilactobacillus sp. SPB1-3]MCZ0977878.1 hypothetical protein [Lentilactobacillus sp. SPB1-3]